MTKKHYEAIASILNKELDAWIPESKRAWFTASVTEKLADYFETDNKNFNRAKFIEACRPKS